MNKKSISILGVEITQEHFPNLYRIAEHNPDGLSEQLQGWAAKSGSTDLQSVATTLEHDLEHERRIAEAHPLTDKDLDELAVFFDLLAQFDHEDKQRAEGGTVAKGSKIE